MYMNYYLQDGGVASLGGAGGHKHDLEIVIVEVTITTVSRPVLRRAITMRIIPCYAAPLKLTFLISRPRHADLKSNKRGSIIVAFDIRQMCSVSFNVNYS